MSYTPTYLLIPGIIIVIFVGNHLLKSNRLPYPPGPSPIPIIGNLFDWPRGNAWLKCSEWYKQYGDINHITVVGQHIVILNTFALAKELLDKSIFSDRPSFVMAGELMGFLPSIILSRYGAYWKFTRRIAHQAMNKTCIAEYWPYLEEDTHKFVKYLYDNPRDHRAALRFFIGKNIVKTTYGIDVKSPQDKHITISEATHNALGYALIPGSFLVDVLPFLKYVPSWFPGAGFQKHAIKSRLRGEEMVNEPYFNVKRAFESGNAPLSFVSRLLNAEVSNKEAINFDYDHAVKWAAGSLYGAGTESTFAVLSTIQLALTMNPDVLRKAQKEMDEVVGKDRLPSFEDQPKLRYLGALIKESMRWHPPVPLSVARMTTEDNQYRGFFIPGRSVVLPNLWAISQDPENYKNPAEFNPERFLTSVPELDPTDYIFGFGRRSCIGVYYATSLLYILTASLVAAFDIKAQDEDGRDVVLNPEFCPKFTSYPEPFPCRIIPRSSLASSL